MNKLSLFLGVLLVITSCKTSRNLPAGSPDSIRPKALMGKMQEAQNTFQSLHITGSGHFDQGATSQSFKLDVRILSDSLVWVDIADPLLGIKVVRAVIYKDSVAFVNRLQKQYFIGKVEELRKRLNLDFGFDQIQAILSGNLVFDVKKDFELYYEPGTYLLSDFDPSPNADVADLNLSQSKFRQVYVLPNNYKPKVQVQKEPALGKNYTITFEKMTSRGETVLYPELLTIESLDSGQELKVTYDVKKVEVDKAGLNYPFNIPSSYAEIR